MRNSLEEACEEVQELRKIEREKKMGGGRMDVGLVEGQELGSQRR